MSSYAYSTDVRGGLEFFLLGYRLYAEVGAVAITGDLADRLPVGYRIIAGFAAADPAGRAADPELIDRSRPVLRLATDAISVPEGGLVLPAVPGGAVVPGADTPLTRVEVGTLDAAGNFTRTGVATGLVPFTAPWFISALTDSAEGYKRLVSLLDDATRLTGTAFGDWLEVGAGDDRVRAGAGNDLVRKWKAGDLDYHGGPGTDALDFASDGPGASFPEPFAGPLVVDLAAGTGRNPYGGRLTLTSVEVIRDTPQADRILGSSRSERVESTFGGGDTVRLKGGADVLTLFSSYAGTLFDGGAGRDRLELVAQNFGAHRLDLGDPSRNAGDFAGLTLRNVEEVVVSVERGSAVAFAGGAGADSFTMRNFRAQAADADLRGRGGADLLRADYGDDTILGGTGADTLIGGSGANVLTGGAGRDHFAFDDLFAPALTTIRDFRAGTDLLDFRLHEEISGRGDLTVTADGRDTLVRDGDLLTVRLIGVAPGDLTAVSFLFDPV